MENTHAPPVLPHKISIVQHFINRWLPLFAHLRCTQDRFGQWYGRWRLGESSQCITASFFLLEQPDSRVHLLRYTEQSFVFGANCEGKKGL